MLEAETRGLSAVGRIKSMENLIDPNGNRNGDVPAANAPAQTPLLNRP